MKRFARLAGCALALAAPAHADTQDSSAEIEVPRTLSLLQQRDIQLTRIGWRLATANAPYCAAAHPQIGLLLQDAQTYRKPDEIRAKHGAKGDIWAQAVAPGSPAHEAGLTVDSELVGFGRVEIARDMPPTDPVWLRLPQLYAALDAVAAQGPFELHWRTRGGEVQRTALAGVPACPSRFEVLSRGDGAAADGARVIFGRDFAAFGYPEDELAAAVAHELAHNLLGHPSALKARGRQRSEVRLTERDADRMMPWLLANAGYDPHAAARFMRKWGPRYDGGLFRRRTHDGWDERVDHIEAEIALVEARMAESGAADWSRHFVRMADSMLEGDEGA